MHWLCRAAWCGVNWGRSHLDTWLEYSEWLTHVPVLGSWTLGWLDWYLSLSLSLFPCSLRDPPSPCCHSMHSLQRGSQTSCLAGQGSPTHKSESWQSLKLSPQARTGTLLLPPHCPWQSSLPAHVHQMWGGKRAAYWVEYRRCWPSGTVPGDELPERHLAAWLWNRMQCFWYGKRKATFGFSRFDFTSSQALFQHLSYYS